MATFIVLMNFTDQALRSIKEAPDRREAARKIASDLGGEIKDVYMTMGGYDLVVILNLPDDTAAAKFALMLASLGNVRTTTLRAFPQGEFMDIIAALP